MVSLDALLLHSWCPKSLHISARDKNPALLRTDIAGCWLRKEYSVLVIITKMEQVKLIELPCYFSSIIAYYLQINLLISVYQTAVKIKSPQWSLRTKHLSVISYGEIMTFSQSAITYLYLCERIYASCLSSFSNPLSVMEQNLNWNVTQSELKCNTGFRETFHNMHCIIYGQLLPSPF
jgi:hypothetical protein